MNKEFIKIEVNFKFKDGDVLHGYRKVVSTKNVGDYVERQIAEYRQRYGDELSKATVVLFSWKFVPHKQCRLLGVCKDKKGQAIRCNNLNLIRNQLSDGLPALIGGLTSELLTHKIMVRLQAKYYGGYYDVTTYRLYTESGSKTLYEIDAFEDGRFFLDWDDRFLLSKTPYTERTFETLSDAIVYAERHLEKLRKADKVFKLNLDGHFPLTIDEDEAKDFSKWFGHPYRTVENPWKNIA